MVKGPGVGRDAGTFGLVPPLDTPNSELLRGLEACGVVSAGQQQTFFI